MKKTNKTNKKIINLTNSVDQTLFYRVYRLKIKRYKLVISKVTGIYKDPHLEKLIYTKLCLLETSFKTNLLVQFLSFILSLFSHSSIHLFLVEFAFLLSLYSRYIVHYVPFSSSSLLLLPFHLLCPPLFL